MKRIALIENTGKDFFKARMRLAKYLKNNGFEITVIIPNDGYLTKIEEANFKVIPVGKIIRGKGISNQIKFAVDLYKILKKKGGYYVTALVFYNKNLIYKTKL